MQNSVEPGDYGAGRRAGDALDRRQLTHHRGRQAVGFDLLSGQFRDDAASAQHRRAIGQRHHLAELVGDVGQRLALGSERPERIYQTIDVARRQRRRRLVQDQELGTGGKSDDDLKPLALARRHPADARLWPDIQTILVGEFSELS